MAFFRWIFKQSEKGLGRAFLYSMLLGLIFALSVLVISIKYLSNLNETEVKQFADETGCKIVNSQLTCNEDYYEYEGLIIDLNREDTRIYGNNVILTRDKLISQNQIISYEQLLGSFNQGSDFDVNDFLDFLGAMTIVIYLFGFIGSFIGATIFFIIANILLALVMMGLINAIMKTKFKYDQMFKLTIYTVIPYVAFNAITRMIFDESLSGYISSPLPIGRGFIRVLIDYIIIFGLTYLAVKKGYDTSVEEKVELPFHVE